MTRLQIADGWNYQRLEELRRHMRQVGLDALILPRWDAHQSEYVIERDELLAWATGFSGTWGLAVITITKAAVFVDGRYTVQANSEVASKAFAVLHLYDEPPQNWLSLNLEKGARVGFDPLVLQPSLYSAFQDSVKKVGGELIPFEENPVCAVWKDRPLPPKAKAFPFPVSACGEASKSKRNRLAEILREGEIDIMAESQSDNIAWLLNLRGRDIPDNPFLQAFALIDSEGRVELFADETKLSPKEHFELGDISIRPADQFLSRLAHRLTDEKRVLVDPRFGPSGVLLAAKVAGAHVKLENNPLTRLKALKNAVELEGIARACEADAHVLAEVFALLETEVPKSFDAGDPLTEAGVEELLERYRKENTDYVEPSFRPISASGANAAMCHYNATKMQSAALGGTKLYLLDTGGQYLSGTTDTTRTTVFSNPSDEEKRAYTLVLKGHIALATQRFPIGTRGYQLDILARQFLWQNDLDYDHGTGHGVGHFLSVHEHPQRIGKEPLDVPLAAGMTITIEPGHYLPGAYGIRIENLFKIVEVTDGWLCFEPLMYFPIGQRLLERTLLTLEECDWLNSYHCVCFEKLSTKNMSDRARAWLEENTCKLETVAPS